MSGFLILIPKYRASRISFMKFLSDVDVVISRIANGIPVGADMDYIDSLTLESALRNRKEVLD